MATVTHLNKSRKKRNKETGSRARDGVRDYVMVGEISSKSTLLSYFLYGSDLPSDYIQRRLVWKRSRTSSAPLPILTGEAVTGFYNFYVNSTSDWRGSSAHR